MAGGFWTAERVAFLVENYPSKGREWCAAQLGATSAQIRAKASRMQLKSLRVSDAWKERVAKQSERQRGKKRPEQAEVMRRTHAEGKFIKSPEQCAAISERMREYFANNPHPRGALGHKHSPESLSLMSAAARATWQSMTEEKRYARLVKQMKTREANGTLPVERPNASWKAGWREIGGVRKFYRSRWEANYAHYLQWLKERGEILDWLHEPRTFWFDGIRRGAVSYLPDFWVREKSGAESYHEVKGWMDARSKTKIKRMAKYHPDVRLVVIDSKAYRALNRDLGGLVPGWGDDA